MTRSDLSGMTAERLLEFWSNGNDPDARRLRAETRAEVLRRLQEWERAREEAESLGQDLAFLVFVTEAGDVDSNGEAVVVDKYDGLEAYKTELATVRAERDDAQECEQRAHAEVERLKNEMAHLRAEIQCKAGEVDRPAEAGEQCPDAIRARPTNEERLRLWTARER